MRTYGSDYKLILVGDATMSPYEITTPAAASSIGTRSRAACGCQRLTKAYPKFAWINPQPQAGWRHTASIAVIRELMEGRMYPLTLAGLDDAIDALT